MIAREGRSQTIRWTDHVQRPLRTGWLLPQMMGASSVSPETLCASVMSLLRAVQ